MRQLNLADAKTLEDAGFVETSQAFKLAYATTSTMHDEIMKTELPSAEFSVPMFGSTGQGIPTAKSDVEFASIVTSPKDVEVVENWTLETTEKLRKKGINVENPRTGFDTRSQAYESFEGHCHCIDRFMRTVTTKPRLEEMYKSNLVPFLFYTQPIFETKDGLLVDQRLEVWNYIEQNRHQAALPYLYNNLVQEPFTLKLNDPIKRLKLKRDKTVRSIITLHLAFFGSSSIKSLKTPPLLALDTLQAFNDSKSSIQEAYVHFFDNYLKIRAYASVGVTSGAYFDEANQLFIKSSNKIYDLSLYTAIKFGWAVKPD